MAKLSMAEIQQALVAHRSDLARLGVRSLAVFGSVARGEARQDSDIDFLVEFDGGATLAGYMNLKFLLEGLFHRKIDLVTRKAVRSQLRRFIEEDAVRVA